MNKKEIMIVANYAHETTLTLEELCDICHIPASLANECIEYEIIHPKTISAEQIVFDLVALKRLQRALRLQHDLEVNLAGVAVVLSLLDELDVLRAQVRLIERHRW